MIYVARCVGLKSFDYRYGFRQIIIIIIIGIYIAPFPFITCSKALHIVIV